jgi:hypothetical protein
LLIVSFYNETKKEFIMKQILVLLSLISLAACTLQAVDMTPTPGGIVTPTQMTITNTPGSDLAAICAEKGYAWQADDTCWFIQEGNETQPTIRIHYPIELLQSELMESTIDTYLTEYRGNFMANYEEFYQPDFGAWFLEIVYDIYLHSPTVASVRFNQSEYTGGAHPNQSYTSFTFDTAANTVLAFEDLFAEGVDPLASIMPIARERLLEKLAELGMDADTANMFIPNGTDELTDYRNFALTDTDLLLFFDSDQVGPHAIGPQEIAIPISELEGILHDDI